MMQNTILFFKKYILLGKHIENDREAYTQFLLKESKKKKGKFKNYDEYNKKEIRTLII